MQVIQKDLSFNCLFNTFYIYEQLGTIIRCIITKLKYYTMEYFGVLIHTIGLEQALKILAQMDLFINILKYTFQTKFKIIPAILIKSIWLTSNLLMPINKCLTNEQGYS